MIVVRIDDNLETALQLARLTLRFARVNRITRFEDGCRRESDTDHTVMLSLIACAFAARFQPDLDLGLVAQFALVHDLIEAYAGDTVTSHRLTPEERAAKEERERLALERIEREFNSSLPWIGQMIRRYEALEEREARFVKAFDKVMPKLTHVLNGCVVVPIAASDLYTDDQRSQMRQWAFDFPWLLDLWEQSVSACLSIVRQHEDNHVTDRVVLVSPCEGQGRSDRATW